MSTATTKMMKLLGLLIIFAIFDASVPRTVNAQGAQQMNDLADAYMRQAMKRLEREERREQRQEARELRREGLPDLSGCGTPGPVYRSDAPAVPHIQCTTINMGAVVTARPTASERNALQSDPIPKGSWVEPVPTPPAIGTLVFHFLMH
jgi:phosphoglucomutase